MLNSLRTIRFKTLRDLWGNRSRTILVALSIAIGVAGVGMIVVTRDILTTDVSRRYRDINPAHIEITVASGVTLDDLKGLEKLAGVADVQARTVFTGRYRQNASDPAWQTMEFIAMPDPHAQTINKIASESGPFPPGRNQVVAERASLTAINAGIGDSIIVDAMGHDKTFQIVGTVHQQDEVMAAVKGNPMVVVSLDTLEQLQGSDRINTIYLTVNDLNQKAAVADAARERLERTGYTVGRVTLHDPAVHPTQDVLDVLLMVMGILGVLALTLSGFLVTNTISALVAQQIKQIGVMKAIGADTWLVTRAYTLTVLAYGVIGSIIAMPLAERAGYRLADFLARQINVDLYPYRPSVPATVVMFAVGLVVPLVAAAKPLWEGARITVRQAISDYGLGGGSGDNWMSRLLGRVQGLPRSWALALRNTVRVPDRLLLTLVTLGLGGAIFIAVLSVDRSFSRTIDNLIEGQYGMDALIAFNRSQRVSNVVPLAESLPEVAHAEAWYFSQATMKLSDGHEVQVLVQAGPDDSQFYQPRLQSGRWLQPDDTNAIVVNRKWAAQEGVQLGDVVRLDLGANEVESEWVVVGINQDLVQRQTGVFVSLDNLDRVLKQTDRTLTLEVQYAHHDAEALFSQKGIDVFSTQILGQIKSQVTSLYQILVVFLLVMAILTALVGGIGLMGMMSINVLERSKEIGVMRAIGAGTRDILQIFWGESMVITLISFALAVVFSVPMSRLLSRAVGMAFIQTPLDFAYALNGIAYWLVIVVVVGTLASIAPALSAANLSVRASLSYE
ncbi:MAG: ABC transporter permease [Chloroflexi bacterium]|nr:ABC transporter permease [Chloroflexota bacterium]